MADEQFKYKRIVAEIEEAIEQAVLSPGDRVPPVRVLAKKYGVAIATAQQSIRELQFRGITKTLGRQGTVVVGLKERWRQIGVVAFHISRGDPLMESCIRAVQEYLSARRLSLSLRFADPCNEDLDRLMDWARQQDGVVAVDAPQLVLQRFVDEGVRTIAHGEALDGPCPSRVSQVFPDAEWEVQTAMAYLVGLGHKRIWLVNRQGSKHYADIAAYYRKEAEALGAAEGSRELALPGQSEEPEVVDHLARCPEPPTALLVEGAMRASRILSYLSRAGWPVPERISVFALSPFGATQDQPLVSEKLSMLCHSSENAFRRCLEILEEQMDSPNAPVRRESMRANLVCGATCRAYAGGGSEGRAQADGGKEDAGTVVSGFGASPVPAG